MSAEEDIALGQRLPRLSLEFENRKQEETARLSFSRPSRLTQEGSLPSYHQLHFDDLRSKFDVVDVDYGLSNEQVTGLQKKYGPNKIAPPSPNRFITFLGWFFGGFNGFMWIAAALAFVSWRLGTLNGGSADVGNLTLAIVLVVVALSNVAGTIFQEYKTIASMNSIRIMLGPQVIKAHREGQVLQIPSLELVPGDVVELESGDRIPADIRLFKVSGLKVDQSILTGESEPVNIRTKMTSHNYLESKNMTFCGGNVVEGAGIGLVVATGNNTMMGQLAAKVYKSGKKKSYLSKEIDRAIIIFSVLCAITALACFIAYVAWLRRSYPGFISWSGIVSVCTGLMVAYLPVGAPLCLTLTLLMVSKRMARAHVLVKDLTIVETLGSISIIASDKTGTLTQNKMTVVEVCLADGTIMSSMKHFRQAIKDTLPGFCNLIDVAALCNAASYKVDSDDMAIGERVCLGGATDVGIFKFCESLVEVSDRRAEYTKVLEVPFNSQNKYMLDIFKQKKEYKMMMKGAAERMIERCDKKMNLDGSVEELSVKHKKKLIKIQQAMCDKGERVLGLILKPIKPTEEYPFLRADFNLDDWNLPLDEGFTFIGLVALLDPPRAEVPAVIQTCHQAGIKVAMVTGDHPGTAVAIARLVGIIKGNEKPDTVACYEPTWASYRQFTSLTADHRPLEGDTSSDGSTSSAETDLEAVGGTKQVEAVAISGAELLNFDEDMWDWALSHRDIVFARTSPENKLEIVKQMQERGYVVAVTGDGVNDSPALKNANVGVAMGDGSDVAKEAASVILTDNNFKSLLVGIENGRLVFANLKKVFRYLLPAGSFSQTLPVVANVFLGLPLPLSTFLMVYISVISDVAPCLSLVYEKSEEDQMKVKPRKKNAHILDGWVYLHSYLFVGVCESLTAFGMYFYYMAHHAGIPMAKLWLAYNKYDITTTGLTVYRNPAGGFYTGPQLNEHLMTAQTCFYVALVMVQFGSLLGMRIQRGSIFSANPVFGPRRNRFLIISIPISLITALIIVYIPGLNKVFETRPIPWEFWFLPLYVTFAVLILHRVLYYRYRCC